MQRLFVFGFLLAAAATSACAGFEQNSSILAPSAASSTTASTPAPSVPSMLGTWSSPLTGISASSCAGFSWQVTSQTENSLAGTFSATCANGIAASGTAAGRVNGSDVPYTVTGTATVPGLPSCPFSISGTGHVVDSNTLVIPYSGTTCIGPISGEETLRRPVHQSEVPEPTPEPAPEAESAPPPAPAESAFHVGPGGLTMTRAEQVVNATASEFAGLTAARGSESEAQAAATELLRRVIWHLRRAGFDAGRQKNPSGAISGDKLTMFADGAWHAVDIFFDYGTAGVPVKVIFWEVTPPNPVPDDGIPD
jgi:hypothetical protein